MKFRTETVVYKSAIDISHRTPILMLGSCFANSIGKKLVDDKFDINLNPFGTLYNPTSIRKAIELLMSGQIFTEKNIFQDKGMYNSFYHHSSFSDIDKDRCLDKINSEFTKASAQLRSADILFVTFGTSYVYEHIETGDIVGNCHKLPSSDFRRYRLSVGDIVEQWTELIEELKKHNPQLSIIFTVSPIRHLRDEAHDNQLSKSTLLLAIDELQKGFGNVHYFSSYEIVLDDLRDYRFYEQDMTHPNVLAIDYIWDMFCKTYFSDETQNIIKEWEKLKKALQHRPITADNEGFILFLKQTLLKLDVFVKKYPFISVVNERMDVEKRIKN